LTVLLTAGAAQSLTGSNTVFSDDISPGQVTYSDIKDGAVTGLKILNGSIFGSDIADGTIRSTDVANDAITNAKIADGAVGPAQLGAGIQDAVLQPGELLTGTFGGAMSNSTNETQTIDFHPLLPGPVDDAHTHTVMPSPAPPVDNCSGTPASPAPDPGHLCFYVVEFVGNTTIFGYRQPAVSNALGADAHGVVVLYQTLSVSGTIRGIWAYEAP
jgi:hypothetical protein